MMIKNEKTGKKNAIERCLSLNMCFISKAISIQETRKDVRAISNMRRNGQNDLVR